MSDSKKVREELESLIPLLKKGLENVFSEQEAELLRVEILGRKGKLAQSMTALSGVSAEEKPLLGKLANAVKVQLLQLFEEHIVSISSRKEKEFLGTFDYTLPGRIQQQSSLHVVTLVIDRIIDIFTKMGYDIATGFEVETEYYNFEALNIPAHHPARDMQDTFFVQPGIVLRTHTSPLQVRIMKEYTPPLSVLAPGKVYRKDSDITHTPMFHQIEGFVVDKGISFSHLRGTLDYFVREIFGENVKTRFRSSFFPFTEPSVELDMSCSLCDAGKYTNREVCKVCKGTGWIEILGCGMIAPSVFRAVECDVEMYSGFAFGLGVERIAMILYSIGDLRLFYENDLRFLSQFSLSRY
ncbi:MAG: phenylalanine--tRNA ligase subunit alpha [Desulfovibrionaceae bacterium]